jgi:hypothetical protein
MSLIQANEYTYGNIEDLENKTSSNGDHLFHMAFIDHGQ